MKPGKSLRTVGCALIGATMLAALSALAQESKPNLVFILVDNVGWGAFGVYGGTVATPRIDQLAKQGIQFNNYNVEVECTPTRSAIHTGRPIDGDDQTDVMLGKSETGKRDGLLSFIGADRVAARWKQWRVYFTDLHPTGIGPQRQPGALSASAPMAGYPKVYNIEMDHMKISLSLDSLHGS